MSCLAGRVERYTFSASPRIGLLIEATPRLTEDELYKQSLELEPRGMYKA
jgi:hypothetical protein